MKTTVHRLLNIIPEELATEKTPVLGTTLKDGEQAENCLILTTAKVALY
ncbi:MAG TPA: hypothetical protein VMW13_07225 [Dehalococcoidales bacterium]|nr:hypothetical protein [Dehalococcoidales bacterium]